MAIEKISIIGGCGHIGLPLGLVLADRGYQVVLVDTNISAVNMVNEGIMPFMERDSDEILKRVIRDKKLNATDDISTISSSNIIFVTIGTPVDSHQSPVPRIFSTFFNSFKDFLSKGQILVLRSTVFPGTSNWLKSKLEELGVELVYAPERIMQGRAISELYSLPQITSASSDLAQQKIDKLFKLYKSKF